jgi:hypothetical protein
MVHNFSSYVYFYSLHVSGNYVPIIRRNNYLCDTWHRIDTVISPDDGYMVARNM